jgi:hypothetical protein
VRFGIAQDYFRGALDRLAGMLPAIGMGIWEGELGHGDSF